MTRQEDINRYVARAFADLRNNELNPPMTPDDEVQAVSEFTDDRYPGITNDQFAEAVRVYARAETERGVRLLEMLRERA